MNIQSEFMCDFKDFKSFFSRNPHLNILIELDKVTIISSKNNIYSIAVYPALINSSVGTPNFFQGVSILTELLYNIPERDDGKDIFNIRLIEGNVFLKVNSYEIEFGSQIFDYTLGNILDSIVEGNRIDLGDLAWIHKISKLYKDSFIQVVDKYIICQTSDGIYVQINDKLNVSKRYSFPSSFLSKISNRKIISSHIGKAFIVELEGGKTLVTQLYKTDSLLENDIEYAMRPIYKVEILINLHSHEPLLKGVKSGNVSLDISKKAIEVKSSSYEVLSFYLNDNCKVKFYQGSKLDFDTLLKMSDSVNSIRINNSNILRVISQEDKFSEIFISSLHTLIKFETGKYLLTGGLINE